MRSDSAGDYVVSSRLVHMLILTFIGMVFTIMGSILVWWKDDGAWRVRMEAQDALLRAEHEDMEKRLASVEAQVKMGILPGTQRIIERLEHEIDQQQQEHKKK